MLAFDDRIYCGAYLWHYVCSGW